MKKDETMTSNANERRPRPTVDNEPDRSGPAKKRRAHPASRARSISTTVAGSLGIGVAAFIAGGASRGAAVRLSAAPAAEAPVLAGPNVALYTTNLAPTVAPVRRLRVEPVALAPPVLLAPRTPDSAPVSTPVSAPAIAVALRSSTRFAPTAARRSNSTAKRSAVVLKRRVVRPRPARTKAS